MKRPMTSDDGGSYCTTPNAADLMLALGGDLMHEGVAISTDEKRALERLYGFVPEKPNVKPPAPTAPKREEFPAGYPGTREYDDAVRRFEQRLAAWQKWEDPRDFMQAGANINLMRRAEVDGLRLVAWLAKFTEPGADPLKAVVQLAYEADWDVDPQDVDWAQGAEEGEEE